MKKVLTITLLLFCMAGFPACGRQALPISLPNADTVLSVQVTQDQQNETHTDPHGIQALLSQLSGAQPTRRESVQDFPQAEHPIRIDFSLADGTTSTIFAYERDGRYYLEQPYQGIYQITEQQYAHLEDFGD